MAERAQSLLFAVEDGSGFWRVQLFAGVVVYEHRAGETLLERMEATPTPRQWRRFWDSVKRIGVWTWADGYRGSNDRERWLLQLTHGERRIQSSGTGAYPPLSAPTPSEEFLRLCAVMAKLVGGILLPPG